jgi:Tfp pilus assembly protein PilV
MKMKFRNKRGDSADKGEKGFSLLETAIAAVVMMIVGLGAAGGFAFAIRYNSGAADRAASMAIAQAAMEKLRIVSFTDSSLTAGTTTATVSDSVGRGYTLTTTITDTIVNSKITLKKIAVQVVPVNTAGPLNTTASSYYGSVMLVAERCSPVAGTNLH